jgi:hypothetical protein
MKVGVLKKRTKANIMCNQMNARRPVKKSIEHAVLIASRRRCCLCVFLDHRDEVRKGQVAHLNHNPLDSSLDNLVFLCLEHHDEYDAKPSQSKGFSIVEVRHYRDRLYDKYREKKALVDSALSRDAELTPLAEISQYEILRRRFPKELKFTLDPWRYPLWQVANEPEYFAYKVNGGADGVCLIERIDLPDDRIVIACIETAGTPGTSITNCVEDLCFQVCERFNLPAEKLVWLEHYDDNEYSDWSLVTFEKKPPNSLFEHPKWIDVTPQIWQSLMLRPKRKLRIQYSKIESKLKKCFEWPTEALL